MNYTTLVALAKAYADRADTDISDNINNFIEVVEAKINRLLRVKDMSVRATVTTVDDQEYYTLPDDFAGIRDIELQKESKFYTYDYLTPAQMNVVKTNQNTTDYYYTIIAGQFQINPIEAADSTIEIVYYQKVPNLNSTDSTNWVSDAYPDLYLAGLMVEIESFVKNAVAVEIWEARFDKAVQALKQSDSDDRWSGTSLKMRLG